MKKSLSFLKICSRRRYAWIAAACALALPESSRTSVAATAATRNEGIPGYEIIALGRGHGNQLCVAANVDGTKGLMLIDTNASGTILNDGKYKFLPSKKRSDGEVATVQDFKLGKAELKMQKVYLAARHGFYARGMSYGGDATQLYDGLLATDLLTAWNATVDCGRAVLYLNTDPARRQDFGPMMVRDGWTRVPMDEFHKHWTVPCTVSGHRFRAVLGTGDRFSGFDMRQLATAQSYVYDPYRKRNFDLATTEGNKVVQIRQFQVGDYVPPAMMALAANGVLNRLEHSTGFTDFRAGDPIIGVLGGDFLCANRAIIDASNRAVYFKQPAHAGSSTAH